MTCPSGKGGLVPGATRPPGQPQAEKGARNNGASRQVPELASPPETAALAADGARTGVAHSGKNACMKPLVVMHNYALQKFCRQRKASQESVSAAQAFPDQGVNRRDDGPRCRVRFWRVSLRIGGTVCRDRRTRAVCGGRRGEGGGNSLPRSASRCALFKVEGARGAGHFVCGTATAAGGLQGRVVFARLSDVVRCRTGYDGCRT